MILVIFLIAEINEKKNKKKINYNEKYDKNFFFLQKIELAYCPNNIVRNFFFFFFCIVRLDCIAS